MDRPAAACAGNRRGPGRPGPGGGGDGGSWPGGLLSAGSGKRNRPLSAQAPPGALGPSSRGLLRRRAGGGGGAVSGALHRPGRARLYLASAAFVRLRNRAAGLFPFSAPPLSPAHAAPDRASVPLPRPTHADRGAHPTGFPQAGAAYGAAAFPAAQRQPRGTAGFYAAGRFRRQPPGGASRGRGNSGRGCSGRGGAE